MAAERELLERATVALERQEAAFERQEAAFERQEAALEGMMRRWEEGDARAREEHRQLIERFQRSEAIFVEAMSELGLGLQRNTDRLERISQTFDAAIRDVADAVRANTRAVLSMLDRLGPQPGSA